MVVKVLQQPPPFIPTGDFFPSFQVQVLRVINIPFPDPNPAHQVTYKQGDVFLLNWRSNFWGQSWNDWGPCWAFQNVILKPLQANIDAKKQFLSELKAIPSHPPHNPAFPGGSDFIALASIHQLPRSASIPLAARVESKSLEGGTTFYQVFY
jgi:hypothetical protein